MEYTILENGVNILPEENRNTNSYIVISVNNSANSQLRIVNETSLNSTYLLEPIDISPTKFSIDQEYSDLIIVKDGGRKRQKVNKKLAAKLEKHQLKLDFIINCKHNDKSLSFCKVFEINLEDIKSFKFKLCSETTKIEQVKFPLSYMWIEKPKRTNRRAKLAKNNHLVVKYFITV